MDKILIDSDAIYALNNPNDPHHQIATKIRTKLSSLPSSFFIVNLVLYEVATLFSYRINQKKAIDVINKLFKSDFNYIYIDQIISNKAFTLFLSQNNNKTSFVDCANIVVMEELKIEKIFSFDKFYKNRLFR